jgi:hypothetical protein
MKYICDMCGETNECPHNTSGHGYCSKCTPKVKEWLENPNNKSGKLENLPDWLNPFKNFKVKL